MTILDTPLSVMVARMASTRPNERPALALAMLAESGGALAADPATPRAGVLLSGIEGSGTDLDAAIQDWLDHARVALPLDGDRGNQA